MSAAAMQRSRWLPMVAPFLACAGAIVVPAARAYAQRAAIQLVWDAPLMTGAAVAKRADSLATQLLAALPAVTRTAVNVEFADFSRKVNTGAAERVRSAGFLNVGFDNLALLYIADAVRRDPADATSVGNFGSLVFAAGDAAKAAGLLRYAHSIAPKSASIAVSLGNVMMALGASARARPLFEEVLRTDPANGEALLSMASYWVEKGLPLEAFPYLARAGAVTYSRKAEIAPPAQDADHNPVPPPQLVEAPGTAASAPSGAAGGAGGAGDTEHLTGMDVEFPAYPNGFGEIDTFIAAGSGRQQFAKWFQGELTKAQARIGSSSEAKGRRMMEAASNPDPDMIEARPMPTDYARKLNDIWLEAEVRKAHAAFKATSGPKLAQLGKAQNLTPPSGATSSPEAFKAAMRKMCQDEHAMVTGIWMAINGAQQQLFVDVNEALRKYYRAQGGWIRTIADRDDYTIAYSMRDLHVISEYDALLTFEDGTRLGMGLSVAGGGTGSINQCIGDGPPAPPKPPQPPDPPQLAPPPQFPCPFKDHPMNLSGKVPVVGVEAEFSLGCDAVKLGAEAGPFKASRTRVFKQRTTTHYEVSADKSASGLGATISVKATGTVDVIREDSGREVVNTGIELQGKSEIWNVAEATITASAVSTYSVKPAPKAPAPPQEHFREQR